MTLEKRILEYVRQNDCMSSLNHIRAAMGVGDWATVRAAAEVCCVEVDGHFRCPGWYERSRTRHES